MLNIFSKNLKESKSMWDGEILLASGIKDDVLFRITSFDGHANAYIKNIGGFETYDDANDCTDFFTVEFTCLNKELDMLGWTYADHMEGISLENVLDDVYEQISEMRKCYGYAY